ncbi:MAG: tRNA (adenosine(37)-N6)-threonylcarbamoyltransferase complex dimerization subunit type 1 TsaB, partial [Chloroflexota bacterium]|nr:tRNA (adenosine(37)-N6)-threonylcarbamoyltransferase complex dimerization subunit type 1 TsaB [Chloroflexota bacterium]
MLLAIDTATEWVGLALYDGDCLRSEIGWRTRAGHTVELTPSLVRMLAREDTSPQALSAIAISLGPGSFTGLRIGLSLGKALAYALGIPLVGIPTLDILAYSAHRQPFPICALIRAGRGRIAAGFYRQGEGWGPKGA